MKQYKVLADEITGKNATVFSKEQVVDELHLINVPAMLTIGAIAELSAETTETLTATETPELEAIPVEEPAKKKK